MVRPDDPRIPIRQDVVMPEIERLYNELRAENAELRKNLVDTETAARWGEHTENQLEAEVERLRAALAEMLESFTEPEDDNDILRRARAALIRPKE